MPTDAGTRVPLIANWPGVAPRGVVSRDLVDFTDFLPTLCDAAGTSAPAELKIDGRLSPSNPRRNGTAPGMDLFLA